LHFFPFWTATFVFGTAIAWWHFGVTTAISFATLAGMISLFWNCFLMNQAATVVQSAWRGKSARMQRREVESAIVIETAWRWLQARQLYAMAMKSVILIQNAWRRTQAVEQLAVAIGSVTLIQTAWRGMQSRELRSTSIESATLIQTAWRGSVARGLLATAVESVTLIQSVVRHSLAFRIVAERRDWLAFIASSFLWGNVILRSRSATLIQSVCRRYMAFRIVAQWRIWWMLCANFTNLSTETRCVLLEMAPKLDTLPMKRVAEIVFLLEKGFTQTSAVLDQEEAISNEVETLDTNVGPVVCTRTEAVANAPFVSSWSLTLIISCCFFC
jgi:hypothetical protein